MQGPVLMACLALAAPVSLAAPASPGMAAHALWRALSHAPGVAADADALTELFHPQAVVIGSRYRAGASALSIDPGRDFIAGLRQVRPGGFHECEIAREIKQYDRFATVYSVVESRTDPAAKQANFTGVNSIQLYRSDTGWQIVSLYYQVEAPGTPIPLAGARSGVCLGDEKVQGAKDLR